MASKTSRVPAPKLSADQAVALYGVSWELYEQIDASRGERAIPRLTFQDGVLELMSPGPDHEYDRTTLARLFEAHVDHLEIAVDGLGSWTVKSKRKKLGAEADECYVFPKGPYDRSELKAPELVIEVIYHSGSIDKLDVWRRLGVKEVWFWQHLELTIFVRRGDLFASSTKSKLVPAIDPTLLVQCMKEPDQTTAVRALRAELSRRG